MIHLLLAVSSHFLLQLLPLSKEVMRTSWFGEISFLKLGNTVARWHLITKILINVGTSRCYEARRGAGNCWQVTHKASVMKAASISSVDGQISVGGYFGIFCLCGIEAKIAWPTAPKISHTYPQVKLLYIGDFFLHGQHSVYRYKSNTYCVTSISCS